MLTPISSATSSAEHTGKSDDLVIYLLLAADWRRCDLPATAGWDPAHERREAGRQRTVDPFAACLSVKTLPVLGKNTVDSEA